ncbi:MAG: enoyl-acyl-carrier protein reductase [Planctomycetota bacterium]|nr:MAG: enoyl-acyl-carrier protein reductase [Planctomycetota bacterium]
MILKGKKALVVGVANKRSLAWGVAQSFAREGAELCMTYQTERLEKGVKELADTLPGTRTLMCDVMNDAQVVTLVEQLKAWGGIDILVHAVAFARTEDLEGDFKNVPIEGWHTALDVSAYSLVSLTRAVAPLMEGKAGSVLTLSFLGATRAVQNYNVMGVAKAALEASVRYLAMDLGPKGIRVNAVSAGPVRTLSAAGISNFAKMLDFVAERAPLRRNIDQAQVGDAAAFLASELSRGVTGQVLFVDSGYNIVGV